MLQKSRKITVLMLTILAMYSIIANYILVNHGTLYSYVVNPLFWCVFIIISTCLLSKTSESTKIKSETIEYTIIAVLVYIGVYIASQIFVAIGENPYSNSLKGILINTYVYILPIIAKEYTRFKLINNVYEKEKKYMTVLVTIVYIFVDIGIIDITNSYNVTKLLFSDMLPIIAENCLCTYIAFNKMYKPAILYRVLTFEYWLLSPILPKVSWVMISAIDTIIPVILLLYIRYAKNKKDINKTRQQAEKIEPKNVIQIAAVVIVSLWFAMGIFPIKPTAVATGSMEKTLMVGDIAILKKCDAEEVKEGDIIQYQKGKITVIHRVIAKYYENDECFFITKGDNNKEQDKEPVSETQLLGKEIFSIRYLGYPAVMLNRIRNSIGIAELGIETGV